MEIDVLDLICCGVGELGDIGVNRGQLKTLENIMRYVSQTALPWNDGETWCPKAFYIFTQVEGCTYGDRLAALIKQHKLGLVTRSEARLNTNSGNNIRVFVWAVDRDAFIAFGKRRKWVGEEEL